MNDTAALYTLSHLAALQELVQEFVPLSVELQEHTYHPLSFGSWVIVAGRRKRRYRFVWDGKDSLLTVSFDAGIGARSADEWQEIPEHGGSVTSSEAFARVRAVLLEAFAA